MRPPSSPPSPPSTQKKRQPEPSRRGPVRPPLSRPAGVDSLRASLKNDFIDNSRSTDDNPRSRFSAAWEASVRSTSPDRQGSLPLHSNLRSSSDQDTNANLPPPPKPDLDTGSNHPAQTSTSSTPNQSTEVQARTLQEQIRAAERRLQALQEQTDPVGGSAPSGDSPELPEDQKQHESYANRRLQAAIYAVRQQRLDSSPLSSLKSTEDDGFVSPAEAGYRLFNSPLQRPLMYDVYRDKGAILSQAKFMPRAQAVAGNQLQVRLNHKPNFQPGKMWEQKGSITPDQVKLKEIKPLRQVDPPRLAHGLDRVLFNPGISWLQDPRTQIYNYDPRIRKILDFDLFDPETSPEYVTASQDDQLKSLAKRQKAKFFGSTSTMTTLLSHIYFVIMGWKAPDFTNFGQSYKSLQSLGGFTLGARLPAMVQLVYDAQTDTYGIDNDKTNDPDNYVLASLGKSMEMMLVSTPEQFEKHSRLHSWKLSEEERKKHEAYHFTQAGNLMMRSQLDCYDPRLPNRTFDLKTRAVVAVRKDRANWVEGSGYQIRKLKGLLESYERETFDMLRATMLKYLLQARIGGMDGIFVCYHNTATVFGFEYLPREQMAKMLTGSNQLFEQVFRIMLHTLDNILSAAVEHFPKQSLNIGLEARPDKLVVIVSQQEDEWLKRRMQGLKYGKDWKAIEGPKTWTSRGNVLFEVCFDRWVDDQLLKGPLVNADNKKLVVDYGISARTDLSEQPVKHLAKTMKQSNELMAAMYLPNVDAINERERYIETVLAQNPEALERYLRERHQGLAGRFPKPPRFVPEPASEEGQEIFHRITKGGKAEAGGKRNVSWIETPSREIRTLRALSMSGAVHAKKQEETDPLLRYEALEESGYSPSRDA